MSGDSGGSGGRPAVDDAALALLCVLMLFVGAAVVPAFDVSSLALDGTLGTGELGNPGGLDGAGRLENQPPELPSAGGFTGGSPSGVGLSNPPGELGIGSRTAGAEPLPQTPLFVVEAPRSGYWRQRSYGLYTGESWQSAADWRAFEGSVPHDGRTADARTVEYRVRLLTASSSLPTVWQPESIQVLNTATALEVSTDGGVRSERRLPAETTYVGESTMPPRGGGALSGTGGGYPADVQRRYTQLPESTPERVFRFTDRLTADARTPYETATTVRDWLRTNKSYSLNASHEPGEPIADQFIFEMERGYCQYFATAMVVMLRSQGIPARYVVGYMGGERIGENRYLVTADRGHAWVEVYFSGVGWVRFDPTPAGDLPVRNPEPPYNVSLNRSAVAGATVTISVAKNGTPVVGAPVLVNGERVGWTGPEGTVTTRLPYVANVTITARQPDSVGKFDGGVDESSPAVEPPQSAGSLPGRADRSRLYRLSRAGPALRIGLPETNGSTATYRSRTNVTLTVRGDPVAGQQVLLEATVADVPVRNATVALDGERVGRTNASGQFLLDLSGVASGSHTVGLRRGDVSGRFLLTVAAPSGADADGGTRATNVSVSTPLGLAIPGGPATVSVTKNGRPVANAAVTVGDDTIGRTDGNGTLDVTLPVRPSVTVRVTTPGGTVVETTLTGLYRNAIGIAGALAVALSGLLVVLRRRGITLATLSRTVAGVIERVSSLVVSALLGAADGLLKAGHALRRIGLDLARRLRALPSVLLDRGVAALALFDPRRLVGAIRRWLAALRDARRDEGAGESDSPARAVGATADGEESARAPPGLKDLWREFARLVRPPGLTTRTPGEVAAYAVRKGLPEGPVETLTDIYRDAEYGNVRTDESRLDRARRALESIRSSEEAEDR